MQELLYTSVPRGLKPGSRGFCTVLSTQNMVAPLAVALEGLSAYRPVFPIGHARVAENPVVYSHLKLQVAGKSWYVLSRVADYGLDYSQRTNKLAHHLVLDKSELPTAGPASLLRTAGIMRESWEGDPKVVPPKPISRQPSTPTGVCLAWKDMTGDAGWAGVLAESFLKDSTRPVILLFEPGQDLRPLIDESLSLLPPEKRWDVTFSTYFTGSSQGITCLWRGIVVGSKEATESLRFVNALRIDLTSTDIGRAAGGELVEAARKGIRPTARPTLPPKQTASREQQPQRVVVLDNFEEPTEPEAFHEPADTATNPAPVASHDHSQTPPRLTRSAFKFANARRQTDGDDPGVRTSRGRQFIIPLLIILLLGGFTVAIVAIVWQRDHKQKLVAQNTTGAAGQLVTGDTQTGDTQTGDTKTGDTKTGDTKTGDTKTGDTKTGDTKTGDTKTGDTKTGDTKTGDTKTGDTKTGDTKTGDTKTGDTKTGDTKTGDTKTGDTKTGDTKTAVQEAKASTPPTPLFEIFKPNGRPKDKFSVGLPSTTPQDAKLAILAPKTLSQEKTPSGIAIVRAIIGGSTQKEAEITLEHHEGGSQLQWKILNEGASKDPDRFAVLQLCLLRVGEDKAQFFRFHDPESIVLKKGRPMTFASPLLKSIKASNLSLNYGTLKLRTSALPDSTPVTLTLESSDTAHAGLASWELKTDELKNLDLSHCYLWITAKSEKGREHEFEIHGKVTPKSFSDDTVSIGKKLWEKAGDGDNDPPIGDSASANETVLSNYLSKLGPLLKNLIDKNQRTEDEEKRLGKLKEIKADIDSLQKQIKKALATKDAIEKSEAIDFSISFTHKLDGKPITLSLIEIKGGG